MIPMGKPLLGEEEKRAVLEVLDSGIIIQGQKVAELERSFANYIGTKHAIATSNGTTALHAALLGIGIKEGDEVITTPFSFVATANAIKMCGAKPVFVDIEEKTFNIDTSLIEKAITSKTKAILPVHLFGLSADMNQIELIAKKYDLKIIEDACQAHGATFENKKVGSFGTGCFSFYPTKNMTKGEGGMITTDDDQTALKIRKIISHGSEKRYYHSILGYNYRMTDIAASIGIEQLKKLDHFNEKRKKNSFLLRNGLSKISGLEVPVDDDNHVFHQFTIRIKDNFPLTREEIISFLNEKGIASSIFYPLPIHQQEAYKEYNNQDFPVAEKAAAEVLSIPVHPALTSEEIEKIISAFKEMNNKNERHQT